MCTATVIFDTGGIRGFVNFVSDHSAGIVRLGYSNLKADISALDFEIHEFLVDYSLAPNVRCRSENVGPLMHFRYHTLYEIFESIRDLIMHSMVMHVRGVAASCGNILPYSLPNYFATVKFRSDIFGKLYVIQWTSE